MTSSFRQYSPNSISHSHDDHHQIVLPVQGVLHLDIEQHQGDVAFGMGALITAGQTHAFAADNTAFNFLVLDHPIKPEETDLWDKALKSPYFQLSSGLQSLCQYGVQSFKAGLPDLLLEQWQSLLISSLSFEVNESTDHSGLTKRLAKACQFMESNLGRMISNQEIADHIHLSPSRFESLFKSTIGIAPQQWMTQRKIEKACELMAHGHSLKAIAQDLGFSDQSSFGKAFRKAKDQSPAQYRKSLTI